MPQQAGGGSKVSKRRATNIISHRPSGSAYRPAGRSVTFSRSGSGRVKRSAPPRRVVKGYSKAAKGAYRAMGSGGKGRSAIRTIRKGSAKQYRATVRRNTARLVKSRPGSGAAKRYRINAAKVRRNSRGGFGNKGKKVTGKGSYKRFIVGS